MMTGPIRAPTPVALKIKPTTTLILGPWKWAAVSAPPKEKNATSPYPDNPITRIKDQKGRQNCTIRAVVAYHPNDKINANLFPIVLEMKVERNGEITWTTPMLIQECDALETDIGSTSAYTLPCWPISSWKGTTRKTKLYIPKPNKR
eukprot:Tbor_TRINITY_DN5739_c0_g1::TRINITY_DN5739_c0_g1_i3::g.20233::m.20233